MPLTHKPVMAMLNRQVLLHRDEEGWTVSCPSLPGCHSQGATQEAALKNIKEAIEVYVESLEMDGLPVPKDGLDASLVTV